LAAKQSGLFFVSAFGGATTDVGAGQKATSVATGLGALITRKSRPLLAAD
jgi:hypothetical protein